jgi:alpha-methylacyl-CoA racemase
VPLPEPTLRGVRILDLTRLLPGPYATWLLASMGAEVLRIEAPSPGDYSRFTPPMLGGASAMFHVINRGKRSLAIDLKQPRGRELLLRLVPSFDVVIEQFRPGVLDRLGLGYETLKQAREDVILCSLSGYGQDGPMSSAAGHDLNFQALAGTLWMAGAKDGPPPLPALPTADLVGAGNAALAIVGALLRRDRAGGGAWLDISLADSCAAVAAPFVAAWTGLGPDAWQRGGALLGGGIAQYQVYETKDGRHLAVGSIEPKFFRAFAEVAGHPEWRSPSLFPGPQQRSLIDAIAAAVAERTLEWWVEALEGVDCCVSPVLDPGEAMERPVWRARSIHGESDAGAHPAGWVEQPVGPPVEGLPPGHGEHTDAVLAELGLGVEEIAALRADGVVE